MIKPSICELTTALQNAWSAETSYAGSEWIKNNPARGQCVVSSLVVQDYYSGDLIRYAVTGEGVKENHYCNILEDGTLLDTTRSQYTTSVSLKENPIDLGSFSNVREKCLADEETRIRYEILKNRVAANLKIV